MSRTLICSSTAACVEGNLRQLPRVFDCYYLPRITWWRHECAAISAQYLTTKNSLMSSFQGCFSVEEYILAPELTQGDKAVWKTTAVSHCSPEVYIHLRNHDRGKARSSVCQGTMVPTFLVSTFTLLIYFNA